MRLATARRGDPCGGLGDLPWPLAVRGLGLARALGRQGACPLAGKAEAQVLLFTCHLIRVFCIMSAMEKRAAQRLVRHLIAVGYRIRLRRHRSLGGSFYSVQVLPPKRIRK